MDPDIRRAHWHALPEPSLVAAARVGSGAALDELMRRYEAPLRACCRRMCGADEYVDVVQDTLLQIARSIDQYRGESSFLTWATAIARSQVTRHRRRRRFGQASLDERRLQRDTGADPERNTWNHQLRDTLAQALGVLAPLDREVLVLCQLHGLTAPEAASSLGLSVPAVKSRLHRARRVMQAELAQQPA